MWLFPIVGLLSLIWYLIRVIPKPSRAMYPCQRVAFPLAFGFVAWLVGLVGSVVAFERAKSFLKQSRMALACTCFVVTAVLGAIMLANMPEGLLQAEFIPTPHGPVGEAKGVNPGRVVWVHDPNATDWEGPGFGNWWESSHTNHAVVDEMMHRAIRELAGKPDNAEAWDAIFKNFNLTHHGQNINYQAGQKITIKVNFVGFHFDIGTVNSTTYEIENWVDYMNTSPQMMLALLVQLIEVVGVSQSDISIGDSTAYFANQYYNVLHDVYPDVRYLDRAGNLGRTVMTYSSVPVYWSNHPTVDFQDYVPQSYADADYIINMANLKTHTHGGITLCAKNHYGSLIRVPGEDKYYDLHTSLPAFTSGMGHYRVFVDLMGHPDIGGKTLLYMVDGLYAGHHSEDQWPKKMDTPPFNSDWSSSLLVSQDPVAIDSVGYDILLAEWPNKVKHPGAATKNVFGAQEDYLHEAAQADNPPSGTFYDPNHSGDVERLGSLGAHEHWNNAADKQYSRNLGTGSGIELVKIFLGNLNKADINMDCDVGIDDFVLLAPYWLDDQCAIIDGYCGGADYEPDGDVDLGDFSTLGGQWHALPGKADKPIPSTVTTNRSISTDLSWTAGEGAKSHDVYFGIVDPCMFTFSFQGNQTSATFDAPLMLPGQLYYWRIDEKNDAGTTTGDFWSFTTASDVVDPNVLVCWYKFDENEGYIANDFSGNSNNAVISGATWVDGRIGKALDFERTVWVSVPTDALLAIANEITVTLWQYGDVAIQPQSDRTFQATDDNGYIVLDIRLPWGTGVVGWDAGNSGPSTFDRLSKTASPADYEGQWNHWAFTKNATTGEMKIYLNGSTTPWASATGKIKTMAGISEITIGSSISGLQNYDGIIDDFRIYNKALSGTEIDLIYQQAP